MPTIESESKIPSSFDKEVANLEPQWPISHLCEELQQQYLKLPLYCQRSVEGVHQRIDSFLKQTPYFLTEGDLGLMREGLQRSTSGFTKALIDFQERKQLFVFKSSYQVAWGQMVAFITEQTKIFERTGLSKALQDLVFEEMKNGLQEGEVSLACTLGICNLGTTSVAWALVKDQKCFRDDDTSPLLSFFGFPIVGFEIAQRNEVEYAYFEYYFGKDEEARADILGLRLPKWCPRRESNPQPFA